MTDPQPDRTDRTDTDSDSLEAYRAVLNPPSPWPSALRTAAICALLGWLASLGAEAWHARQCFNAEGFWSRGACEVPTLQLEIVRPGGGPIGPPPPPPTLDK